MKTNLIFLAIDLMLLPTLALFTKVDLFTLMTNDLFSMLLLLDSGVVFLIGGSIVISSSIFPSKVREHAFHSNEDWSLEKHKKSEMKANLYILTGILLLLESIVAGFVL